MNIQIDNDELIACKIHAGISFFFKWARGSKTINITAHNPLNRDFEAIEFASEKPRNSVTCQEFLEKVDDIDLNHIFERYQDEMASRNYIGDWGDDVL